MFSKFPLASPGCLSYIRSLASKTAGEERQKLCRYIALCFQEYDFLLDTTSSYFALYLKFDL